MLVDIGPCGVENKLGYRKAGIEQECRLSGTLNVS